jgi:hypothetical protein
LTTGASPAEDEGREPERDDPGGFVGRGGWHLVAFLAALALVLVMSIDWYTTEQGEEFRRVEKNAPGARQVDPDIDERAAQAAENQEKTAWQADALVDRLILLACLIAFIGAVAAAFMRSAGRRPQPPWHPSAIATVAGVAGTLLILYRMFQPPDLNEAAVIKMGAPLGLIAIGVLTIGSRLAVLGERDELAGPGGAAVAPGPQAPIGEQEARERGEGPLSRLRRRRAAMAEAPAEASAPAEEPGPTESTGFEFDFPAAAPPSAADREEPVEPEPEPVEPEPVEPEPVEPEPVEPEPEPDPDPVEPEPDPVEPEPVEEVIEEEPVEPEHDVGEVAVDDEPVADPPVEEPDVDAPAEPLEIGEEIEFEYEPPPPDPDAGDDEPDRSESG